MAGGSAAAATSVAAWHGGSSDGRLSIGKTGTAGGLGRLLWGQLAWRTRQGDATWRQRTPSRRRPMRLRREEEEDCLVDPTYQRLYAGEEEVWCGAACAGFGLDRDGALGLRLGRRGNRPRKEKLERATVLWPKRGRRRWERARPGEGGGEK